MLVGLARVSAVAGSLLLNLEAPITMLLAVAAFGEHLGRRAVVGAVLVTLGAIVLSRTAGDLHGDWVGAAAIGSACLCWVVDNNLTQRLSLRDPIAIVRAKGFGAGSLMVGFAVVGGSAMPHTSDLHHRHRH